MEEVKNKIRRADLEVCRKAYKAIADAYHRRRWTYNSVRSVRMDRVSKTSQGNYSDPTADTLKELQKLDDAEDNAKALLQDLVPKVEAWLQEVGSGSGELTCLVRWYFLAGYEWEDIDNAFPPLYKTTSEERKLKIHKDNARQAFMYYVKNFPWIFAENEDPGTKKD